MTPRKRLYAGQMREFTIEEWLVDVGRLVSELTASETLLLNRLREIRLEMAAGRLGPLSTPQQAESHPLDPRPRQAPFTTVPVHADDRSAGWSEPAWPNSPTPPPGYAPSTVQLASYSQESWPGDSDESAAVAASTTRSYDYFAELDEKLAVLQQSGREA